MSTAREADRSAVAVVMGSASDLEVMQPAASSTSGRRCGSSPPIAPPPRCSRWGGGPPPIWGCGCSSPELAGPPTFPGMQAAVTALPVIGDPVPLRHLDGRDSLLSIVQMLAGVPVAAVGIGAARNAGLLAARILALDDPAVAARLASFAARLAETTRRQDTEVAGRG